MGIYTVKAGDTLSAIAKRFNTTVAKLVAANGIKNANVIHVGQKLNVSSFNPAPVPPAPKPPPAAPTPAPAAATYKVRAGDTLGAIAKKHGTTVAKLVQLNGIKNANVIHVGQVIKLPGAAPATPTTPTTPTTPPNTGVPVPNNVKVAFIGDSHTYGAFGTRVKNRLNSYLGAGGGSLTTFTGVPSAGTSHFLSGSSTKAGSQTFSTPTLASVLAKKPKALVVALGSNQFGMSKDWNKDQIRKVLAQADAAGTKVTWVGPPDMRGYSNELDDGVREARFYAALAEVNAERKAAGKTPMTIIDSRKYTKQSDASDKVHFSGAAANKWADAVFDALT